jgi:phosphoribosylaminoimidazole-succinocarboxamide synthase
MSGIMSVELPGIPKLRSGKVREVFDLGDNLLIVATDRISAFDCILPDPVPEKGILLTQLSAFWFQMFHQVPSHFVTVNFAEYPENLQPYSEILSERSMLVKKADPLPVECVVRGYLAGSGWKEYQEFGSVCGIRLPPGLEHAAQLPKPIFTPATKEASGHDRNIPWEKCCELLGEERATIVRDLSLAIYSDGSVHAGERVFIIAETKFLFGVHNVNIFLIDECLSPV